MDNSTSNKKYFYSNTSKIMGTPYDISLLFERSSAPEVTENSPKQKTVEAVVVDSVEVSMSPSHAKAVASGLLQALIKYENQFGKIAMPPEKNKELNTLISQLTKG